MKYTSVISVIISVVAIALLALWGLSSTQKVNLGSAPTGMRTIIASSTVKAVVGTTSPITLFSFTPDCTSRVITTYAIPILITFASSTDLDQTVKPTATFGHLQGASTTVVYDAGTYGCDEWQAYGYEASSAVASTTISLSEFKGFK